MSSNSSISPISTAKDLVVAKHLRKVQALELQYINVVQNLLQQKSSILSKYQKELDSSLQQLENLHNNNMLPTNNNNNNNNNNIIHTLRHLNNSIQNAQINMSNSLSPSPQINMNNLIPLHNLIPVSLHNNNNNSMTVIPQLPNMIPKIPPIPNMNNMHNINNINNINNVLPTVNINNMNNNNQFNN
eukprot:96447_1